MKLLLRPKPIPGESWPGYLLRLAEANTYQGTARLAKGLGKTLNGIFTAAPAEVLQMLEIALPENAAQPLTNVCRRRPSLFLAGRPVNAKVCAQCLHEMDIPYLKSDWDRAFAFRCREHGILLVEACHSCGIPLTYLRNHVANCNCGFRLSHTPTMQPEAFIYRILDVLHLRANYGDATPTFGCSEEQELAAQCLLRWLTQLNARLYGGKGTIGKRSQAYVSLDEVRKVSHWFDDWPKAFIRHVVKVQIGTRYTARSVVFGNSGIDPLRFPKIAEALDAHVLNRRTTPRPKGTIGLETATLKSKEFVDMHFVMVATGCSGYVVRQWLSKGWLGDVRTSQLNRSFMQYRISREAASKAIQLIRSTASAQELAKTIGMKVGRLRDLARYGVLHGLPCGKAEWNKRLVPEEVFQLTTRLLAATKRGMYWDEPRILLEAAILRLVKRHSGLIASFIEAVLNRQIPTRVFLDKHPTRLDQISLKVADFVCWREKNRKAK